MRRFFKTKMHQNAPGGQAPPRPAGGAHSAPQDYLAVFREGQGPRKGKRNGEEKGKGEEGRGRKKGEGEKNWKEGERRRGERIECAPPILPVPPTF